MFTGIYQILNKVNGKFYIGSALDIKQRWRQHKHYLRLGNHQNIYLQRAWNKYWETSFEFLILEICSKEELITKEQAWLNWTQSFNLAIGYNLNPTAGSSLGIKHSDEAKQKMSAAKKKMTEETKLKMSLAHKGKKRTEEHKANIQAAMKGKIRLPYKSKHQTPPIGY